VSTMDKFICYLDILGFQSRIANTKSNFKTFYDKLVKVIVSEIAPGKKVKLYAISDSVIIISDDIKDVVTTSFAIYSEALHNGIFVRGALTYGPINDSISVSNIGDNRNIVIPYLGDGYLKAYKLGGDVNCAAIYIDNDILSKIKDVEHNIFKYTEIFSKKGTAFEKSFLISDMNNYSVPQTILSRISDEIPKFTEHQASKFIDTFCLYYSIMRDRYNDTTNLKRYHEYWVRILESLCKI